LLENPGFLSCNKNGVHNAGQHLVDFFYLAMPARAAPPGGFDSCLQTFCSVALGRWFIDVCLVPSSSPNI